MACDTYWTSHGFSTYPYASLRWQETELRGPEGVPLVPCSEFDFCPEHPKGRSCSFSIFEIKVYLQLLWSLESVQSLLADALCGL